MNAYDFTPSAASAKNTEMTTASLSDALTKKAVAFWATRARKAAKRERGDNMIVNWQYRGGKTIADLRVEVTIYNENGGTLDFWYKVTTDRFGTLRLAKF